MRASNKGTSESDDKNPSDGIIFFIVVLKFKHYIWAYATSEKNYWYCLQINQWNIIGDKLLMKIPIELKHNSSDQTTELPMSGFELVEVT